MPPGAAAQRHEDRLLMGGRQIAPLMNSNPSQSIEYSQERQESGACPLIRYVANSNRWLDEMPWLKPQLKSWSKENVIEEALKYPSKVMFHNKSSVAYRVALRNGWMDEIEIITGWKLKSI